LEKEGKKKGKRGGGPLFLEIIEEKEKGYFPQFQFLLLGEEKGEGRGSGFEGKRGGGRGRRPLLSQSSSGCVGEEKKKKEEREVKKHRTLDTRGGRGENAVATFSYSSLSSYISQRRKGREKKEGSGNR